MACGNLGVANDFNVFIFTDHTQSNVDSEGRVAVGGTATYMNYGVGSSVQPVSATRPDLIIGGNVNITNGSNFAGNTVVSPDSNIINYTMTNNNRVPNQPLVGMPIDFVAAERDLTIASTNLAAIPPNGTIRNNFGQIVLTGTDPAFNVFTFNGNNVDGAGLRLDTANGIDIVAPVGSTILINVGGDNVGFGSYQIFRNGITATREDGATILWNFFQATAAFNQNLSITGSVLAPYADWSALGFGNINGTIIANSLTNVTGSIEEHDIQFMGCLPPEIIPPPVMTSSTSSTTTTTTTLPPTTTSSTTSTSTTSTSTTTTGSTTTSSTTTASTTSTSSTTTAPLFPTARITATKTANVTTARLGDIITYTVIVQNEGNAPGEAVLGEQLPRGVFFAPGSLTIDGGRFLGLDITEQIILGTLAPGQIVTITFEAIVASVPPGELIINQGSVVAIAQGTVMASCNPREKVVAGMDGVLPRSGQLLPVSLAFKPGITPTPGQPIAAGPFTLPDGRIILANPVTIPGITLPPILGVTIPLIGGTLSPIVSANPVRVPIVPANPNPNLIVFQRFFGSQFFIGQRVTYSIYIINNGSATSGRTLLQDTIPPGAKFIAGTVRVNRVLKLDADPNAGIALGPIPVNQGVIVRYDILVTGGASLTNFSTITAEFLLPDQSVSIQRFQTTPITNSILPISAESMSSFVKIAKALTVSVGSVYEYAIEIRNLSDSITAENVVIFDNLDSSLQFVSGSMKMDGIPQMDPRVGFLIGNLAPGQSRTLAFAVRVQFEPNNDQIINSAAAFFEFRFRGICFRGGLVSDPTTVFVAGDEEE